MYELYTTLEKSVCLCYYILEKGAAFMLRYKIDILEELKEKGYSSYKLRKDKLMGEAQIQKISSGELVSKETLNTICKLLNCQPGDILEYVETEE